MQISITTNFPQVQRKLDLLAAEVRNKVTARAINRTMDQAKTQMVREIRNAYMVDSAFVRERLRVKRASFAMGKLRLQAELDGTAKRRSANVIRFGARQTLSGVSVKIKRGGARKVIKGAFVGNKERTVFERVPGSKMASRKWGGKHGQQIKPVQTVDVPQMFNTRRINAAVVAAMQARFPAIFERELAYALSQFKRQG